MGSYAWKSILRGRDIIQRGYGGQEVEKKVNIWQQRWLPRKHPPQQPICTLESFENHIMDTLFDPITRRWNEGLVDGLFVIQDAKLIKKIPLSRNATQDTLYWPYSNTGDYSCRFGYRFHKEESEMQANTQAPPIRDKQEWKEIWQMRAPPKVKKFIWRACHNALPTKQSLM